MKSGKNDSSPPGHGSRNQSYAAANLVVLLVAIYSLMIPVILPEIMPRLPPQLRSCAMPRICGSPCPLCGLTRAIGLVFRGEMRAAVSMHFLSIPLAILLLLEIAGRTATMALIRARPIPARLIKADIIVHGFLATLFALYCAAFLMKSL